MAEALDTGSVRWGVGSGMRRRRPPRPLALARLATAGLMLACTLACGYEPKPVVFEPGDGANVTRDGLQRIADRRLAVGFLRPGARLEDYDAIEVDPVTIRYRSTPREPTLFNKRAGNFALGPELRDRLQRIVHAAVERAVVSSGVYALASEPGPRVLELRPHIIDLEYNLQQLRGAEDEFVLNAGQMTLFVEILDATSDERLVVFLDPRRIKPAGASVQGYQSTIITTWTGIRDISSEWAGELAAELRDLHASSPVQLEAARP